MLPHPATACVIRTQQYQERLRAVTHERLIARTDADTTAVHASRDSVFRSMRRWGYKARIVLPQAGLILAIEMKRSPHAPDA
jgi:hypothetical protein